MAAAGLVAACLLARPAAAVCSADLDGDGDVDVLDLLEFLACHEGECPGDFNGNGSLDGEDMAVLLLHWGPCDEDLAIGSTRAVLAVADITDPTTAAQGLREFDVFVPLDGPDAVLLNVFEADVTCDCPGGFVHSPVLPGALPLPQNVWETFDLTYDSFVTIGPSFGDDNDTGLDGWFSESDFLNGTTLGAGAGWWVAPSSEQGRAGNYPGNRVRIATFTNEPGTSITGPLTVAFRDDAGALFFGVGAIEVHFAIGDLDGDGVVGTADLLALLAAWGPCPGPTDPCPGDLDGDGNVGTADLLLLLAGWG